MVDLRITTDAKLAEKMKVAPSQLSGWLCGHTKPRRGTILLMASSWGVTENEVRGFIAGRIQQYENRTFKVE